MNIFRSMALAAIVGFSGIAQAHYFRASMLSSSELLKSPEIVTWGDFHYSNKPKNKQAIQKQLKAVLGYAKALNAAVIVEDGATFNETDLSNTSASYRPPILSVEELETMDVATPLHGLSSLCEHEGIPCTNVEFRFSKYRPLKALCQLVENKKKQILSYDDGNAFNNYYREKLAFLEETIEKPCQVLFKLFAKTNLPIGKFTDKAQLPKVANIDTLLKTIYFDEELALDKMSYNYKVYRLFNAYCCAFIDLEIMHAIAKYQNYETIFICAGDFHTECVKQALAHMGYKTTATSGDTFVQKNGIDYLEPTAIDVEQILDSLIIVKEPTKDSLVTVKKPTAIDAEQALDSLVIAKEPTKDSLVTVKETAKDSLQGIIFFLIVSFILLITHFYIQLRKYRMIQF